MISSGRIRALACSLMVVPEEMDEAPKSLRKRCADITDKYDLKTGCKQIAAYFIWRSEETGRGCGGPRQRVAGFSRRAGAGQG